MAALSDFFEEEILGQLFRTPTPVTEWTASTAYSLGDRVVATTFDGNIYECTSAGTSNDTEGEPTWNTTLGATTTETDGVEWTAYKPAALQRPVYLALFDTTASLTNLEAGTLTGELSGNGYSRVAITPGDANWSAISGGTTDNVSEVSFTTATGDWNTVRYAALLDASTGGNVIVKTQLPADKTTTSGQTFKVNAGDIDITLE